MSDEEEFMSEESGSDFSVSEEEYKPNEDSESSDFSGHEDQDVEESMVEAAKQKYLTFKIFFVLSSQCCYLLAKMFAKAARHSNYHYEIE